MILENLETSLKKIRLNFSNINTKAKQVFITKLVTKPIFFFFSFGDNTPTKILTTGFVERKTWIQVRRICMLDKTAIS